ncbi:MAG: Ig-like domain-containing protein [Candidatus Micrarchaeota archaeon]
MENRSITLLALLFVLIVPYAAAAVTTSVISVDEGSTLAIKPVYKPTVYLRVIVDGKLLATMSPEQNRYHTVSENQLLTFSSSLQSDDPGDFLEIIPETLPEGASMPYASGYTYISSDFSWTPNYCQGRSAPYEFDVNFLANSFFAGIDTHFITVNNVNRNPVITTSLPTYNYTIPGNTVSFSLTATDIDKTECNDDSISMSYNSIPSASGMSFTDQGNGNAIYSWTPSAGQYGTYAVTFTATDSHSGTHQKTVNIVVLNPDGPTTFANINEGQLLAFDKSTGFISGYDLEVKALAPLPTGATFTATPGKQLRGQEGSGRFSWTPDYCQGKVTAYQVKFQFYNHTSMPGLAWRNETVNITVNNVNRNPVITTNPTSPVYLAVGGNYHQVLAATDADVSCGDDSIAMSYSANPVTISATFFDQGNGNAVFDWTPSVGEVGIHTLTFKAQDQYGGYNEKQVIVEVFQPRGTATYTINEGQYFSFARNVMGFGGENLKIEPLQSALPAGSAFPIATGTTALSDGFNWRPNFCQKSDVPYSFTVKYWGSDQNYDTETININVNNVNRKPVMSGTPCYFKARAGRDTVTFDFTITDVDEQCSPSEETAEVQVALAGTYERPGKVTKNTETNVYTYQWKPDKINRGMYSFTITATDSHGGASIKPFQVYVLPYSSTLLSTDMVFWCRSADEGLGDR